MQYDSTDDDEQPSNKKRCIEMHSIQQIQQNAKNKSRCCPVQSLPTLDNAEAEEYAIVTTHPELECNADSRMNALAEWERLHQVGDDWVWRPYPDEAYEKNESHEWYMRITKKMPKVVVNHVNQRHSAVMTMSQEFAAPHSTDENSEDDSGEDCDEFVDGMDEYGGRSTWLGGSALLPYDKVGITMYFPSDDEDAMSPLEAPREDVVVSTSTFTEAEASSIERERVLCRVCQERPAGKADRDWRKKMGHDRCRRCGHYWIRHGTEWTPDVRWGGAR